MSEKDRSRQNESPEQSAEADHTSLFGDAIPKTKRKGIGSDSLLRAIDEFNRNEQKKRAK